MTKEWSEQESKVLKPKAEKPEEPSADVGPETSGMLGLQQTVGNRAVQRLLAQRSADESGELDDETAGRIKQARSGGRALDSGIQKQMGAALGYDFGDVRVHSDSESDALNRQLSAKAFTTGQDVFFRQGDYAPDSDSGRELIAHELTHVVQQGTGAVSGGPRMKVNPAGDVYEQEADTVAGEIAHAGSHAPVEAGSRGAAQRQTNEEEEPVEAKALQRQEQTEEEEPVETKALQRQEQIEEEEEPVETKALQRQEQIEEEEEPVETKALQRQDDEEFPEGQAL